MKTYHIVWFEKPTDIYSTGQNYNGDDEVQALSIWRLEYPSAIFHSMSAKCDIPEIELDHETGD